MTRVLASLRRLLGFALLPLSILPFVLAVPVIARQHDTFDRINGAGPLPAPTVGLTTDERARFKRLAPTGAAVPVLAYHGLNDAQDGASVSPEGFARQLRMLRNAGFESISVAQYARFRRGETAGLPERPVLITFDDGRLDSFRRADALLEAEHQRAVMFAPGGPIAAGDLFHLTWKELHVMRRSGRWDVQPQGFDALGKITSAEGEMSPFYAARRFLASTGREPFAAYEQRVTEDVFKTRELMLDQGIDAPTFAVPYGDYGQLSGNDERIAPFMADLLTRQFGTFFVQAANNEASYSKPGRGVAERFQVHTDTTLETLYGWLRRNHPATLAAAKAKAAAKADAAAERRRAAAREARAAAAKRHKTHRAKKAH